MLKANGIFASVALSTDGTHRERVKYGFDENGNRTWRENLVAASGQDEFYSYDRLNQLLTLDRGDLNGTYTGISGTPSWEEDFTYDPTGNWQGSTTGYLTKTNGTTDLNQNRTHNKANEITDITETVGAAWATPVQNLSGNLTEVPKMTDLTTSNRCKYDPWNRLCQVFDGAATVARYAYDGLNRRVTKLIGTTIRHYYYSNQWQVLEERLDSNTSADRQFVWGLRYIDDLIERDRGSERFYVLQDPVHVTAVVDTGGAVVERYGYGSFGAPRYMDATFGSRASSSYVWETLFGVYRHDAESGLYQVRNRYLHPKLGRWLFRDPIGYSNGTNLYAYVGNGPMNWLDPLGLQEEPVDYSDPSKWVSITTYGPNVERYGAIRMSTNAVASILRAAGMFDPEDPVGGRDPETRYWVVPKELVDKDQIEETPAAPPLDLTPETDWRDYVPDLEDYANFFAGWADALTFNITDRLRERWDLNETLDRESLAYGLGQTTQTAIDLASGGSSLALRGAVRTALGTHSKQQIRGQGRRYLPAAQSGFQRHHRLPLFGHPGAPGRAGRPSYWPTGGLRPSWHSGRGNISFVSQQAGVHNRLFFAERVLIGNAIAGGGRPYAWFEGEE